MKSNYKIFCNNLISLIYLYSDDDGTYNKKLLREYPDIAWYGFM